MEVSNPDRLVFPEIGRTKGDVVAREIFIATTFICAGIGAGLGAALGMGNKNETIYEAP